jgi:hypothetical protein
MAKKFIKQIDNQNFVFPNKDLAEYDVEIIHDLNENSVSGTINSFSATTVASTGLTFNVNYTFNLNDAEPFYRVETGGIQYVTVHLMTPQRLYYKPWRFVHSQGGSIPPSSGFTGTMIFNVLPFQFGQTSFTNGTYYFEFRFVGKRAVYPVCYTFVVSTLSTPTPTPSPSPTSTNTPTPTPTPGGPATFTPTPSASPTPLPNYYYRLTRCEDSQTYWSQAYPGGTFSSGDRVEGGSGVYYVISGSQTTNPGGSLLTVTDTGLFGCP